MTELRKKLIFHLITNLITLASSFIIPSLPTQRCLDIITVLKSPRAIKGKNYTFFVRQG